MIKQETITTKICDRCKNEVAFFVESAGETRKEVYTVKRHIYYGDVDEFDLCEKCHNGLVRFLNENS